MSTEKLTAALAGDHKLRLLVEAKTSLEKADDILKDLGLGLTRSELAHVLENVEDARCRRTAAIVDEFARSE